MWRLSNARRAWRIGTGAALVFGLMLLTIGAAHAHGGASDDHTRIGRGKVVNGAVFVAGRDLEMAGEVEGDYICAGQNVTISGQVDGDVLCAAQSITISGRVDGDVRLASQTANLSGTVGGSLSVASQRLYTESLAVVGRDASVAASDVRLAGRVGRDLQVQSQSLVVDAIVGRNITAYSDQLVLAGGAQVTGNLAYPNGDNFERRAGAQVGGRIERIERTDATTPAAWLAAVWLLTVLALLATSMVLVLLAPRAFGDSARSLFQNFRASLLAGVIVAFVVPVASMVLAVTVIGLPLAVLLALFWLVLVFLSGPVAAFAVGRGIVGQAKPAWLAMLVGSLLLVSAYSLPFVGTAALLLAMIFGSGAILVSLWRHRDKIGASTGNLAVKSTGNAGKHDKPKEDA